MTAPLTLGVDFGTTNTVVATSRGTGPAELVAFDTPSGPRATFRSTLSFNAEPSDLTGRTVNAGPWAIEAYLDDPGDTRFIQSFKSYAASPLFTETRILGRRHTFEDMLSTFLLRLRENSGTALNPAETRLIAGRPVRFVGAAPDPALALKRYQVAFERLGFSEILFVHEPVAAAFYFARRLEQDATVLVADFGGGTSDFSVIRFERRGGTLTSRPMGQSGVGLAGDAFDFRIIDNLVSPALGKGSLYRDFDNILSVPSRYYASFARWDQLALMQVSRDMRDIRGLVRKALEPEKLEGLIELIEGNHGYPLYQAVSRLKETLSTETHARFSFRAGRIAIEAEVARTDFNGWIAHELAAIERAVDAALADADLGAEGIDRVFLTGGSSFVPAVRALFDARFGPERIASGSELESIASGLALIGSEPDLDQWCTRAD